MRRKLAESSPNIRLCPLCEFVSGKRSDIVKHLMDRHSDQEAFEYAGKEKEGW